MTTYPQERPAWCPHPECEFVVVKGQHKLCGGKLPEPEPHDDDENTHRMCLLVSELDPPDVFDLQINKTDAWWFSCLFGELFAMETRIVTCGTPTTDEEIERLIVNARRPGKLTAAWEAEKASGLPLPEIRTMAGLPPGTSIAIGASDRGWVHLVFLLPLGQEPKVGWAQFEPELAWEEGKEHPLDREGLMEEASE